MTEFFDVAARRLWGREFDKLPFGHWPPIQWPDRLPSRQLQIAAIEELLLRRCHSRSTWTTNPADSSYIVKMNLGEPYANRLAGQNDFNLRGACRSN